MHMKQLVVLCLCTCIYISGIQRSTVRGVQLECLSVVMLDLTVCMYYFSENAPAALFVTPPRQQIPGYMYQILEVDMHVVIHNMYALCMQNYKII